MRMTGTSGVQEQSGSLDRIARHDDGSAFLEVLFAVPVKIDNAVNPAVRAQNDARGHRVGANLCSVCHGIRNVGNQRARFRADFASLQAKATIDSMLTGSVGRRENGNGTTS